MRVDLWERLPERTGGRRWRVPGPAVGQRAGGVPESGVHRPHGLPTAAGPVPCVPAVAVGPHHRADPWSGPVPPARAGARLEFQRPGGCAPTPVAAHHLQRARGGSRYSRPATGDLTGWARQGVLLLNAVLTVRAGQPRSHAGKGWEQFTDAAIRVLSDRSEPMVFVLWGAYARRKTASIDQDRHVVLTAAHPSPLAGDRFRGSRPFSAINEALRRWGRPPVDWAALDTGD